MFDIAPSEFLLVAFVALVVIGPKDLPKAMRVVGYWVGKARGVARQFRSGFDSMVREAELEEMEKRWASENERIMREHPQTGHGEVNAAEAGNAHPDATPDATNADAGQIVHAPETETHYEDHTAEPVMVEKPVVTAAKGQATSLEADRHMDQLQTTERGADLFDAHAPKSVPDDKSGKPDVAPS